VHLHYIWFSRLLASLACNATGPADWRGPFQVEEDMPEALKDIIAAKSRRFEENFARGDVPALVADYYNNDPVVIGQGVATFTGREGATQYFTGAVEAMKSAKLTTYTIQEGEDSAIETGGVKLTPREDGAAQIDLTYVLVWQRHADGWAVHMDYFMPGVVR